MQKGTVKKVKRLFRKSMAVLLCAALALPLPALAAPGVTHQTPTVPMELPIEVEIELSPAGSLKQAALWKELVQLLYEPDDVDCPPDDLATPLVDESQSCTATIPRRPGFGVAMPPLKVFAPNYNFLTGQPMRLRTTDGEISWDQPGPLFDPAEEVEVDQFNTPIELREPIGHLVACPNLPPGYQAAEVPADFCDSIADGSLVVFNTSDSPVIPPTGTVVAVAAVVGGELQELDGESTTATVPLEDLEIPVNEEDFLAGDLPAEKQESRFFAEVLGKALFWDMQIGSDGVQACGTCHFHAGVDNRTRGQLNPGVNAGDLTLQVKGPDQSVTAGDFPFHKLADPDASGESTNCGLAGLPPCADSAVVSDANDVMSSMGVSRFKQFIDIPPIGTFLPPVSGVAALPPDLGFVATDPVPVNEGLRRVEPRNTPTFHGAAFNLDNFWDGRARFNFNGGSVFGPSDPFFHVFIDEPGLAGATMGHFRDELLVEDPEQAEQPVRAKFSSLASQAVGPPLSDFEMSFAGRNWAKIGKKLLQTGVTPLANQLVDPTDSRLGPYSNQGGEECITLGREVAPGKPGLCVSYPELIEQAFRADLWQNTEQHLAGAAATCVSAENGVLTPPGCDPFDGYVLTVAEGPADPADTDEFTQMEANFSTFFGMAVQMYEELTIPDDTPADRFFDANPNAGHAVGEPGDQAVLFPTLVPDLMDDGILNNTAATPSNGSSIVLIPDDPSTPEYDGFGPDEIFGFDLFAGGNLTAALAAGTPRNPLRSIITEGGLPLQIAVGSNPFTRSAKCMLCHLGPEQTDHSINISHGVLKNDAEFEYPTPPFTNDPSTPSVFLSGTLPAPEPSGSSQTVLGLILSEEVSEGPPQDAVEVEPRNFATFDDPATPWDDRIIAQPENFAFGDQGIYNIGVRPSAEDAGRGGPDPFGWPLSLSALTLKNIGGPEFEPCDTPDDICLMANVDAEVLDLTFEETGDAVPYPAPGGAYDLQAINPGFERDPIIPLMPEYMVPWINGLPAGELHPQIDEMAGFAPNTVTPPNGGPGIEFPEILFGADLHCALYDPVQFGSGPPNFGWGAPLQDGSGDPSVCPQNQSGVAGNFDFPAQGTWPVPNRVLRDGAFKAPPLRNVEMTGPYFHTGSFLTLRQVVDFYFRGGDFPVANQDSRDPHIVELEEQSFAFGRTTGDDLRAPINFDGNINSPTTPYLVSDVGFADGLPDTVYLYDEYPDSDHPYTPEPVFASRAAALEDAKNALVKFLLALTDPRVKYERAPFDRPEIFRPLSGMAPDNISGRAALLADGRFQIAPAIGAAGRTAAGLPALDNFLGVASVAGPGNDHFDAVTVNPAAATAFDDFFGTMASVPLIVTAPGVLVNDISSDGGPLTAELVSGPTQPNATLTLNADGSFTYLYAADLDTPLVDSFTYRADDGTGDSNVATAFITITPFFSGTLTATKIGTYRQGTWYLDADGNGQWQFGVDRIFTNFGAPGDLAVTGDWDGDGVSEIGVYRQGTWYLDANGNGSWDPELDTVIVFGASTDKPVSGDVDGDGIYEVGVFRPSTGQWYFDLDNNGWTLCQQDGGTDLCLAQFGSPSDIPVTGNMDGDASFEIGVYRPSTGQWYFDLDNNGWTQCQQNGGTDLCLTFFGAPGDIPVTGDWDGNEIYEVGVYRQGIWYLDANGNGLWDPGTDTVLNSFGAPGDIPVTGNW